jgi:hypothetical protein
MATVGNVGTPHNVNGATSNTGTLNNNGDTVIVWEFNFSSGGAQAPTGVTYAGVAMTRINPGGEANGNFSWSEWILPVGATHQGSNNIVASYAATAVTSVVGISYIGVNQSTPNRTATVTVSSSTASAAVTPATQSAGDLVVAQGWGFASTQTPGGSQTEDSSNANVLTNGWSVGVDHASQPAAFTWTGGGTISGTFSGATGFALINAPAGALQESSLTSMSLGPG